jgi:hypothetical protein
LLNQINHAKIYLSNPKELRMHELKFNKNDTQPLRLAKMFIMGLIIFSSATSLSMIVGMFNK